MKIDSFEGKNRFLSNFYLHRIEVLWAHDDGELRTYYAPSNEHGYQALKATNFNDFFKIINCATPGEAKRLGKRIPLRQDWEAAKLPVMRSLCRKKFDINPLMTALLDTGDAELIEGNWWGDTYWGVCKGVGENHLGKILMQIRKELKLMHETTVV